MTAFDQRTDDLLVIERPPTDGVAGAMGSARVGDWKGTMTATDADARATEALAELCIECLPLADDIAGVARSFLSQYLAAAAQLRVEVHDRAGCPKFHCNNVVVRLVVTYHGPATETVEVAAPDDVRRAPTGALVFLKGHKHPRHADAVLHRSPPVPAGEKRLCIVLTPIE